MKDIWQLIPPYTASGEVQMALDSWLLDRHNRTSQSVLRFYRWSPAAISLGYHQRHFPDRWLDIAEELGLDIVRRPSGGRAVIHGGELTYAVITRASDRTRQETYQDICEFLIQGFAELDIQLSYGKSGRGYIRNPSCFATATAADLVIADGRKLIGSAQVYRHGSVLQHGSIAIQPDSQLLQRIFASEVPIVGLQELFGQGFSSIDALITKVAAALTKAAAKHFNIEFVDFPIADVLRSAALSA